MMSQKSVTIFACTALMAGALAAQPAAQGYLDVGILKVKLDKRAEFDGLAKKFAAANRAHKGDNWVAYGVEYGEQDLVYFVSTRANYGEIDTGQKAFMDSLSKSYGAAGVQKLMADGNSYLVSSRSEIRTRRPDLSANLPRDNAALENLVGKSHFLRIVTIRTRPGRGPGFEAQLRAIKDATEKGMPGRVTTVSQSGVGQPVGIYYLTNFGDSMAALATPKTLPELLGDRAYRDFTRANADDTLGAEITIARFLPELSNPQADIAAADPAFWNPKPAAAPAKPKATQEKK